MYIEREKRLKIKERKDLVNSKIVAPINYGAALFSSETQEILQIYHTAMMSAYGLIKNHYVFKESCQSVSSNSVESHIHEKYLYKKRIEGIKA